MLDVLENYFNHQNNLCSMQKKSRMYAETGDAEGATAAKQRS